MRLALTLMKANVHCIVLVRYLKLPFSELSVQRQIVRTPFNYQIAIPHYTSGSSSGEVGLMLPHTVTEAGAVCGCDNLEAGFRLPKELNCAQLMTWLLFVSPVPSGFLGWVSDSSAERVGGVPIASETASSGMLPSGSPPISIVGLIIALSSCGTESGSGSWISSRPAFSSVPTLATAASLFSAIVVSG